jgi:hypothetical protein
VANLKFRNKASTSTKPKKPPKVYEIDGCEYKSKALQDLHKEFKAFVQFKLIKSFTLPTIGDGQKKSKYGALKAEVDSFVFASVMEARFYTYLLQLLRDKQIKSFERQISYELQEKFKDPRTKKWIQAITYISDFVITNLDGSLLVIDVKGRETADFKLKKKMFGYKYRDLPLMCVQWEPKSKEWMDLDDIKKEERKKKKLKEAS